MYYKDIFFILLMSCTAMTIIIQAFIFIIFSGSLEAGETVIEQIPQVYEKREFNYRPKIHCW